MSSDDGSGQRALTPILVSLAVYGGLGWFVAGWPGVWIGWAVVLILNARAIWVASR